MNSSVSSIDFSGEKDLRLWLATIHSLDMLVVFRPGPYICAEWDLGGLPGWLLNLSPTLKIRTLQEPYMSYATLWWIRILELAKPYLYQNGGPIVLVQVENEFGFFGDVQNNPLDHAYMVQLIKTARQALGPDIILFTCDYGDLEHMQRGSLADSSVLTTGNFGPSHDPMISFSAQAIMNPEGYKVPMVTEYYSGWLSHWGERMANTSSIEYTRVLDQMLGMNASVSVYMGFGGTNFGLWNGANLEGDKYEPTITSYDYDAPLAEDGSHGYGSDGVDKFIATLSVLRKYSNSVIPKEPPANRKLSIGIVTMQESYDFFSNIDILANAKIIRSSQDRLNMESFFLYRGFALYTLDLATFSPDNQQSSLKLKGLRDRATIFIDDEPIGTLYRPQTVLNFTFNSPNPKRLQIFVENLGHVNFGPGIALDLKGVEAVSIDGRSINSDFVIYTLPLDLKPTIKFVSPPTFQHQKPVFFRSKFTIDGPVGDVFVNVKDWSHGLVWVNGNNLGRYWSSMKTQYALYCPASFLRSGENELIIFEVDGRPPSGLQLQLTNHPEFY